MFFAKQGKDNKPTYLLAKQRSKVQKKTDGLMKSKVQGCQTMFDGSIQKWTARLSIPPQWLCRGKTPSSAVHSRPQDPRLSCASPGIKYIIRHFMPSKNLSDKDTTWAIQCWYSWGGVKVTYTLEKHFPKLIDLIILVLSTFGGNMWKPCGSSSCPINLLRRFAYSTSLLGSGRTIGDGNGGHQRG